MMKDVAIDPEIRRDPGLVSAIERASSMLDGEIGPSAGSVSAEWSHSRRYQSGSVIVLRISDKADSATVVFDPPFLKGVDESKLRSAFNWLWGDLLQVRSHKQIEALKLAVQNLDDDEP